MLASLNPVQVWSLRVNPSDLYNIERGITDNPLSGGGDTYIQIPARMVPCTLAFLGQGTLPPLGSMIPLDVHDPSHPAAGPERIEFWRKSDDQAGNPRMRIARQNRHRHGRFPGWAPVAGFPNLGSGQLTDDARALLGGLGGLRIFLARDAQGPVWGGFTTGAPSASEAALPYASIAWAPSAGGCWP